MVYCGKASQGCQNCRTRRIKVSQELYGPLVHLSAVTVPILLHRNIPNNFQCDKVRPDCSQCIRVGKKCPGYRDQLSLMFRDESSKVIQKAHAQWGLEGRNSSPLQPPSTPPDAVETRSTSSVSGDGAQALLPATSPVRRRQSSSYRDASRSDQSDPSSMTMTMTELVPASYYGQVSKTIGPSLEEQGIQFYVNRYLIGHPDEPRNSGDLDSSPWLWSPALQDVMTAVGLAGLSTVKNDGELMTLARQRYGTALRRTGQLIQKCQTPSLMLTMRAVVMLLMFEVGSCRKSSLHVRKTGLIVDIAR